MARRYGDKWTMAAVAKKMKRVANQGSWGGLTTERGYVKSCYGIHEPSGTHLIFTREYHLGFDDYDKCFYLGLVFVRSETKEAKKSDKQLTQKWLELFFGNNINRLRIKTEAISHGRGDFVHCRLPCGYSWLPL